jgi:hypothetical protein
MMRARVKVSEKELHGWFFCCWGGLVCWRRVEDSCLIWRVVLWRWVEVLAQRLKKAFMLGGRLWFPRGW